MTTYAARARVEHAGPGDTEDVLAVIRAGFGARPPLDPPSSALEEGPGSVRASLAAHGGLVARLDGESAGALLFEPRGDRLGLRRVAVRPEHQGRGVAAAMAEAAENVAAERGHTGLELIARVELPRTVRFWRGQGYVEVARRDTTLILAKELAVELKLPTAEDTRALGERVGRLLRAGDLVVLDGGLGAGKTTLTQGLGAGLGVRGPVTSPTFVIARVHPSLHGGPPLVHVDAYRLGSSAEVDDLDLDTALEDSATVVEWGAGVVEGLAEDRLEITLSASDPSAGESRTVRVVPRGRRWLGVGLACALDGAAPRGRPGPRSGAT